MRPMEEGGPSQGLGTVWPKYTDGPAMRQPHNQEHAAMGQPEFGLGMRVAWEAIFRQPGQLPVQGNLAGASFFNRNAR